MPPFHKLFMRKMHNIRDVLGAPGRILLFSIHHMNSRNIVNAEHGEIAHSEGISRTHVSRILRELEKRHFIVIGRGKYMVNPDYIFMGSPHAQHEVRKLYKSKRSKKNIKGEVPDYVEKEEG